MLLNGYDLLVVFMLQRFLFLHGVFPVRLLFCENRHLMENLFENMRVARIPMDVDCSHLSNFTMGFSKRKISASYHVFRGVASIRRNSSVFA